MGRSLCFILCLLTPFLMFAAAAEASEESAAALFEEVSNARGLGGLRGHYLVWGDVDDDGHPDLLVAGRRLFRNSGPPAFTFTDVSDSAGLGEVKGHGLFVDVDNDGDLDLPTTEGQLWIQNSGRFTNRAETLAFKVPERCSGFSWFDMDGDGRLDVYCTVGENWNKGRPIYFSHKLLINTGKSGFEDATPGQPMDGKGRYGRSVSACDYDLDGDLDLYVGNYRIQPNFFLSNDGRGGFSEIGRANSTTGNKLIHRDELSGRTIGPYYGHTIGSAWADFNNDGLFDLFVANLVHKYVGPVPGRKGQDIRGYICDDSKVYINQGGPDYSFKDVRVAWGIPLRPTGGRGVYKGDELWSNVVCGDYDNDGYVDAFVPQIYDLAYAKALLLRNRKGTGFENLASKAQVEVINTYGGAWADFDSDGRLDLACMGQDQANPRGQKPKTHKSRLHLFRNLTAARGNWIRFDLRAASGNRYAVGAQVSLKAGELLQVRQMEVGTGSHAQQNDPRLHFGLGQASEPDVVLVRWGGGLVELLCPVPKAGTTHTLTEPARPAFHVSEIEINVERKDVTLSVRRAGKVKLIYLWDLDGNGSFEKRTSSPQLSISFPEAGAYRIRVLALDPATALGVERTGRFEIE